MLHNTPSFHPTTPYFPGNAPPGIPFEEFLKVCNERDMWRVRYEELK